MPTFAIIAHPVGHSLSPAIHNAAFQALGLTDNEYIALDTPPELLSQRVKEMRENTYGGYSVSIPHKQAIMPLLDEILPQAGQVGSVNTVINKNGYLLGDNTDYGGFRIALAEQGVTSGEGKRAVVLGAGGASLAIIAVLLTLKYSVIVVARDPQKAKENLKHLLLNTSGVLSIISFADFTPRIHFDLLVNTTPIGMSPKVDESPLVDTNFFQPERLFFDIIYNPLHTKLLTLAMANKCRVATGDRMLLWQAVGQCELWTGQKAPVEVMEKELKARLSES